MYRFLEKNKVTFVYFPLCLFWLFLFVGTSMPGKEMPDLGIIYKYGHFLAYMILSILLCLTYLFQKKIVYFHRKPFQFAIITIVLYSTLDELHQLLIPGRTGRATDVLIDVSGALLGLLVVYLFVRFSGKERTT